jgi:hypothetical protein
VYWGVPPHDPRGGALKMTPRRGIFFI